MKHKLRLNYKNILNIQYLLFIYTYFYIQFNDWTKIMNIFKILIILKITANTVYGSKWKVKTTQTKKDYLV